MPDRAHAEFDVTGWEQEPYEPSTGAGGFSRATVRKVFRGDLTGESVAELLLYQRDPQDLGAGAGYVASERVEATLRGRKGTFVLQHWGVSGDGHRRTGGHVIPGSATAELRGLVGQVEIQVDAEGGHSLTLDYDLPALP